MHLQRDFSSSTNRHNPCQADSYLQSLTIMLEWWIRPISFGKEKLTGWDCSSPIYFEPRWDPHRPVPCCEPSCASTHAQLINMDIFPLMKSADSLHSLRALVNVLDWQSAIIWHLHTLLFSFWYTSRPFFLPRSFSLFHYHVLSILFTGGGLPARNIHCHHS